MTCEAVANRSGVAISTVKRLLGQGVEHASFAAVISIANALGLSVKFDPDADEYTYRQQQAQRRARELVGLVQGSSALEGQAVAESDYDTMIRETVYELMAGSPRRLWA